MNSSGCGRMIRTSFRGSYSVLDLLKKYISPLYNL